MTGELEPTRSKTAAEKSAEIRFGLMLPLKARDAMRRQRPTADDLLGPAIAEPFRERRIAAKRAAREAVRLAFDVPDSPEIPSS